MLPNGLSGLYTDFYELTMARGYFDSGKAEEPAVFDYFFRRQPFEGGYAVFCGSETLAGVLEDFSFSEDAIRFLADQHFPGDFLDYLQNLKLRVSIDAAPEGSLIFAREPVMRVEGPLVQCQLIETVLLNVLNFETLVATKASRIRDQAGERTLIDFGMRRAHGLAARQATRAAIIGGFDSSSNVLSGYEFDHPVSGTQAHAWIQSFDTELEAFRSYAESYPDSCVLLVDTYDTLKSGVPNAIKVGKELEQRGYQLKGIRLDSGDLVELSKSARKMLDDAGLNYVKIAASNELDEFEIQRLSNANAPIELFGIGTRLVTGAPDAALDGVYKLSQLNGKPKMKVSENPAKSTLPGLKQIFRKLVNGKYVQDTIALESESPAENEFPLHKPFFRDGKRVSKSRTLSETAEFVKDEKMKLPDCVIRLNKSGSYSVKLSDSLRAEQTKLSEQLKHI